MCDLPAADLPAAVRDAFEHIDADNNGAIDSDELLALFRMLQPNRYFGAHAVEEALREMGAENRLVSLPAFCKWWEARGKFTPSERLDLKWCAMQSRFDSVMSGFACKFAANLDNGEDGSGRIVDRAQRHAMHHIGGEATAVDAADHDVWHGSMAQPDWEAPILIARSNAKARPGYDGGDASEYRDTPSTLQKKVKVLAALLRASSATCVYTGAGISTASGIGDYASKADCSAAPHRRGKTTGNRLQVMPTKGHHVLAALQAKGLLHHWLQQNHDRLAQKAGYPTEALNEIHGAWGDDKNPVKMMDDTLRPDLLEWMEAWEEHCTLCLALGTSLCGMNADRVADAAARRTAPGEGLVIVNLQRTPKDAQSCLRIWGLLDDVLGLLAKELKLKAPNRACVARGEEWVRTHPNCRYNTPKRKVGAPL